MFDIAPSEMMLVALVAIIFIGPKDLPPAIVARVNAAINKAIAPPEAREKLEADGAEPAGGSAEAFGKLIAREIALWGQVVRELGIRPE